MDKLYKTFQITMFNRTLLFQRITRCSLCTKSGELNKKVSNSSTEVPTKMKRKNSPKITLAHNHVTSVISLEEAHKLAKRRDLCLVQVQQMDSKTMRPTYKLVTPAEIISHEMKSVKEEKVNNFESDKFVQKKHEKTLTIGSRISEHDLAARLKHISKWLGKRYEVRVLIQCHSSDDVVNGEEIFKSIEHFVTTKLPIGKIVQKRNTGLIIKFVVISTSSPLTSSDSTRI